jgi:hypothetical protein
MYIASESTMSSLSETFIKNTDATGRFKECTWSDKISIKLTTLSNLISQYGVPTFCKIDVEGFEVEVLKGLDVPIPMLSFEYCVPEMRQNLIDCLSELKRIDSLGVFNYCIGEKMSFILSEWMPYNDFLKLINSQEFLQSSFGDIYFKAAQ